MGQSVRYTFLTDGELDQAKKSVVTIGNFDGVHIGHQQIFTKVVEIAKGKDLNPIALSFSPHPREVLGNVKLALLTTLRQRAEKVVQLFPAVQYGKIDFDLDLAALSARSFLQTLIDVFGMQDLVVGTTTHIGKNREGTPDRIQSLAKQMGFTLHLIEPVEVSGAIVSSSMIRNLIVKGDVHQVEQVLGHRFSTSGEVVHGQHLGQALGFPTANIACFASQLLPANGVYAVCACVEGKVYPAAANLGYRPTLEKDNIIRHLEVHLIDCDIDLYGKVLRVEWVCKVRDEVKFNSLKTLKEQVSKDVTKIAKILSV